METILTRKICGQRSNISAKSKRRALGKQSFVRNWYMFLMSNCRGERDPGLCTFWVLAYGELLRSGDFRENPCLAAGKIGIFHCAAVFHTRVPNQFTDLDPSLLYILVTGTYTTFAWEKSFLALGVCLLHLSAGCTFSALRSRLNYC